MSALEPELVMKDADAAAAQKVETKESSDHSTSAFLPLTNTPPVPAMEDLTIAEAPKTLGEPANTAADVDIEPLPLTTETVTTEPAPIPEVAHAPVDSMPETDRQSTRPASTSIWTTAATTIRNMLVKPQPTKKDDSPSTSTAPKQASSEDPGITSHVPPAKIDKGKGKAVDDGAQLPETATPSTSTTTKQPPPKQRPSAPPPRLSSIAHSLPTTSSHPPPQSQSTTSPSLSSLQSPQSTASHATDTSATTATDEENQAAALQALNAVIHSVGTGYTHPLTTRARQLHENDVTLTTQTTHLIHTTSLLSRDIDTLIALGRESTNKLKPFGDLENWTEKLDADLAAVEETLRLVEGGEEGRGEVCAGCGGEVGWEGRERDGGGGGDGEEEGRRPRWCRCCGKGFCAGCVGVVDADGAESIHSVVAAGVADTQAEDAAHDDGTGSIIHDTQADENTLPKPVVSDATQHASHLSTSPPGPPPTHLLDPAPSTQPSVPKPSSMFEWGGIPDSAALEDDNLSDAYSGSDGSEGSGSGEGSDWTQDDWMCQECRLRDDLDGIVMGL